MQQGHRVVLHCKRVILSKNNILIGKGYVSNGMFMLSILCNDPNINKIILKFTLLIHLMFGMVEMVTLI